MSYLGSIGQIMEGSGLEDAWTTVYAKDWVKAMLIGHAYARSVRAHILTYTALGMTICQSFDSYERHKDSMRELFASWPAKPFTDDGLPFTLGDYRAEPIISKITVEFEKKLSELEKKGPTAKLWVQYFRSVAVHLRLIEAQRLGNWRLHVDCIEEMLPLFHAAGHFAYAKSAKIYVQDMRHLEEKMVDVQDEYDQFTSQGFFTIRKSDKAWCGVATDMTIEQTLNRFFGTDLRHGRGVTPSVVARYLQAMPAAFQIMEAVEDYCGVNTATSEQHVDLSRCRMKADDKDLSSILFWLSKHNPFQDEYKGLTSLSTGIIGGPVINCHMAIEKGKEAMALMVGKNAGNISLSKAFKVKSLATANDGAHITNKDFVGVDSSLLFQRIATVLHDNEELTKRALGYELAPFPMSLFDESGFLRKTSKAEMYKLFRPIKESDLPSNRQPMYVIDGGWLLHQVGWPHGKNFGDIFEIYKCYLTTHFESDCMVIFDGYNREVIGVKSYERYRRKEKNVAADVNIEENKLVTMTRDTFLGNVANKFKLVDLLSAFLQRHGIRTKVADEDADSLIVSTAIELKSTMEFVMVIGNDVDILILLAALTLPEETIFFNKKSSGQSGEEIYSTLSSFSRDQKSFLLLAHAFTGCDTTSALFKKGKKILLTMLQKNQALQRASSVFYDAAAEKIIFHLYNADEEIVSVAALRYKLFISSVNVAKKQMSLELLPPTQSALREHAKRVYYQVQQWLGHYLRPEDWGWNRTADFLLIPVMSTEDPAPKELLQKISCGCKGDCKTAGCECRKAGVLCTELCKHCSSSCCKNTSVVTSIQASDDTATELDESDDDRPPVSREYPEEFPEYSFHTGEEMEIDFEKF